MRRKLINRKNISAVLALVLGVTIFTAARTHSGGPYEHEIEVTTFNDHQNTRQKL